jgi:hypothetical protein
MRLKTYSYSLDPNTKQCQAKPRRGQHQKKATRRERSSAVAKKEHVATRTLRISELSANSYLQKLVCTIELKRDPRRKGKLKEKKGKLKEKKGKLKEKGEVEAKGGS